MSRTKRPASEYKRLAERLARTNPLYDKYLYVEAEALTGAQKAAIARASYAEGFASRILPRTDRSYIESARAISKLAPGLKKYARMHLKTAKLTPAQKGAIAHKEKLLRYAHHLIPVKGKTARELKDKLFAPGINAIQLDHTNDHAKIRRVNNQIFVTNNGRMWLYWTLDAKPSSMKRGAKKAFENPSTVFPMERIANLVDKAFKRPTTREVYLWAASGRVGSGFESLKQFMRWFNRAYGGYRETAKWVRGIAIRLGEPPRDGPTSNDDDMEDDFEYDGDDE